MRKPIILTLSLILAFFGVTPALAEPEPDNWIWQATGPVTSGIIKGTIASNNDDDWYMFYAASQTQLNISMPPNPCGWGIGVSLRDTNGHEIDSQDYSTSIQESIKYTTAVGTNRYFIQVEGSTCGTPYSLSLSPATSLLSGSAMPTAVTPTGEPNESAAQATGPLAGDTIYTGQIQTQNDEDWFAFYASAAFTIEATDNGTGCSYGSLDLLSDEQQEIDGLTVGYNWYDQLSYTPPRWKLYYIRIDGSTNCAYRFAISPASAIQAVPAPAPTAPAPMTGLTYRKTRKAVVVYWSAVSGATGYQVRLRKHSKWGAWKSTANTWKTYKRKKIPKRVRVRARAINDVGTGAAQTIKVRR